MDGEWQPQAELRVAYLPHHGYCAHLRARRLCTGPHYTQYDYIDVHGDLIYSRPAQRYRNDAMDSFQRTALAELRALYDLGNAVVTLYFTPHRPTTTNDG
ncbi:hypothetical protein [Nocardia terpenica]|uniref:Uncharacterized protein n=1 Tax=Nocardia terpenica TaxID=455432 RepID=A0A6G9ZDP1_9NOCA|nr:hypothetical protein [Nocardia terpenica]QIS23658.1 hypothetical protein F6W96_40700 [Nocardia terpenica]